MVLNKLEYSKIPNSILPNSWRNQENLEGLNDFLQQNWEQRFVFYNDSKTTSHQQFIDFLGFGNIKTKSYIGTIIYKGEQLNIFPKMFKLDRTDYTSNELSLRHMVYNIVKWIEYSNKMEYPFINISSELTDTNDFKELFITLYIGYVSNALKRSVLHQYINDTSDCTIIKGKLDFKDYINTKIPNGEINKFKCTCSKFEFDNKFNRIIKYTCKQIINITTKKNQKKIRKILSILNEVSDEQCYPNDCDTTRITNKDKQNKIILGMSKMFLLNKASNYTINTNESFCFLFPTNLLFEGFISGLISDVISGKGGKVSLQDSHQSLIEKIIYNGKISGPKFTMRHDVLVEFKNKVFILDTKYKEISRFENNQNYANNIASEINQNDLYQILEYARKRNSKDVFLIYPMYRYEKKENDSPIAISEDKNGAINIHLLRVPFVFEKEEEEIITLQLTEIIESLFINWPPT